MLSQIDIVSPTPLFPLQSQDRELLDSLQLKIVEVGCQLCIPTKNPLSILTDKTTFETILLQVTQDWVVQRSNKIGKIISAFKCDYEINFEIIRKISQIPNKLGQAEGIRFYFKENQCLKVELIVLPENRKQLQMFAKILGRKYLIQLGFHTSFKAIKKIGKGMTACVYNAINFANGREVAIKSFKRSVYFAQDNNNGKKSFCKEFKILSEINHPNICQLHSVFQTDNSTYVILELYPLSLYGYLQKVGFPTEPAAKVMITHLLEGIAYLHSKGIMHRDLKLQNIMVRKDLKAGVVPVIVDLGLAEYTSATKYLYTRCGTPGYVAPQVLKIKSSEPIQTYTSACDVFSLGVILHILLFRKPIFQGRDAKEVIKKNCQCNIDFNAATFTNLSAQAQDLFKKMLANNPSERITARQALAHPYLSGQGVKLYSGELQNQIIQQTNNSIPEQTKL